MSPKENAKYLINELGTKGALIQCYEEWNNADTLDDKKYWNNVEIEIKSLIAK